MEQGNFERKLQSIHQSISEWNRENLEQAFRNQFSSRFRLREDEGKLKVYVSAEQARTDRWLAEYFVFSHTGISFTPPLELPQYQVPEEQEVLEELLSRMESREWVLEGRILVNESRYGTLRTSLPYESSLSSLPGKFETKTGEIIRLEVRPFPLHEFGKCGVLKTVLDSYEWNGALTALFAHCETPLDKVT